MQVYKGFKGRLMAELFTKKKHEKLFCDLRALLEITFGHELALENQGQASCQGTKYRIIRGSLKSF